MSLIKKIHNRISAVRAKRDFSKQTTKIEMPFHCPVCENSTFVYHKVLWPQLIESWEINEEEVEYINRQQGVCCSQCRCNLRSMTLAHAIKVALSRSASFSELCSKDEEMRSKSFLEVNTAGGLTPSLEKLPNHILAVYPDLDMQSMPYEDGTFDVILHSDTLEHVPNPLKGLEECLRVLKPKGVLAYTVPVIFGRPTRRRDGKPSAFHGASNTEGDDWKVVTEYGHDFYLEPYHAGFKQISMHSLCFPDSVALVCRKL